MKRIFFVLSIILVHCHGRPATIDEMTLNPYSGGTYSPDTLSVPAPASTYYLSDGTSWQSGAGVYYVPSTTFQSSSVSDGYIYYDFAPLPNGILFQQTDYDGGSHSAQGTLGWTGDVTLVAQIGSTEATFSGYTTILDNTETWYGQPRFNYYSASVGQAVYFQMDFTIDNGTWQPDTFAGSFDYSASGYVDFLQVAPEPSVASILAAAFTLIGIYRYKKSAA
jgi:hypothetical protein